MEFEAYPLNEYPDINEKELAFPETIFVAYAVCSQKCGNAEWIVDGSSQVCEYCGKQMFRTFVREYRLKEEKALNSPST